MQPCADNRCANSTLSQGSLYRGPTWKHSNTNIASARSYGCIDLAAAMHGGFSRPLRCLSHAPPACHTAPTQAESASTGQSRPARAGSHPGRGSRPRTAAPPPWPSPLHAAPAPASARAHAAGRGFSSMTRRRAPHDTQVLYRRRRGAHLRRALCIPQQEHCMAPPHGMRADERLLDL